MRVKFVFNEMTEMIKFLLKGTSHGNIARSLLKKMRCAVSAPLLAALMMCANHQIQNAEAACNSVDEAAKSLSTGSISQSALKNIKVGKSGYYYLLDGEGTVLAHPNPSIEGINFSGIPMVKSILEKKSGCFLQFFDGREKIVIFRNAGPKGILCFTINAEEVKGGSEKCQRFD